MQIRKRRQKMTSEYTNELLAEVIQILAAVPALWTNCCGPEEENGLSTDIILTSLQSQFPDTSWTLELLVYTLTRGRRQGALKEVSVDTWYLNRNMIANNIANETFAPLSPYICGPPSCQRTIGTIL